MVSLMHLGSLSFQSFAVGNDLATTPSATAKASTLDVYMKNNVNKKEQTPTEGGELVKNSCSVQPSHSRKRQLRQTSILA